MVWSALFPWPSVCFGCAGRSEKGESLIWTSHRMNYVQFTCTCSSPPYQSTGNSGWFHNWRGDNESVDCYGWRFSPSGESDACMNIYNSLQSLKYNEESYLETLRIRPMKGETPDSTLLYYCHLLLRISLSEVWIILSLQYTWTALKIWERERAWLTFVLFCAVLRLLGVVETSYTETLTFVSTAAPV